MQSLLGANHRLHLLHMAKRFIWIEETKERINKFTIGYMINPTLKINKAFIEQVNKCMKTTFGARTQPHIKITLAKKKTRLLALLMFYETRNNSKKAFKVFSYVIYTIISHYVSIGYLDCE